jgi:hypothetical protein
MICSVAIKHSPVNLLLTSVGSQGAYRVYDVSRGIQQICAYYFDVLVSSTVSPSSSDLPSGSTAAGSGSLPDSHVLYNMGLSGFVGIAAS